MHLPRECDFDLDESLATHTGTITVNGIEQVPSGGVAHPTLAGVACMGPFETFAGNEVLGLPGLVKKKVASTARLLP